MRTIAIYYNPKDYPGKYVARGFKANIDGNTIPEEACKVADTIEEAREHITPGMINIGRMNGDDPVIVEVWI